MCSDHHCLPKGGSQVQCLFPNRPLTQNSPFFPPSPFSSTLPVQPSTAPWDMKITPRFQRTRNTSTPPLDSLFRFSCVASLSETLDWFISWLEDSAPPSSATSRQGCVTFSYFGKTIESGPWNHHRRVIPFIVAGVKDDYSKTVMIRTRSTKKRRDC